ncbi:MAG: energy transducer TonB [Myxococcaceae bacterium]
MHARTAESLLASRPGLTTRAWSTSLILHLLLGGGLLVWQAIASRPSIDMNQKPIRATLVRLGKPRDEKLLPRKEELPPPPPPAPAASTPPAPVPPPAQRPGAAPPKPTTAPPSRTEKTSDARNRLFGAFSKVAKPPSADELEGANDGDPMGDSAVAEGERYFGLLRAQVHRHYDISQTLSESERLALRAQVALRIDKNGTVVSAKLVRPSGNDLFDSAVLAAIDRASPFSPPPDGLRDAMRGSGVILEFRP